MKIEIELSDFEYIKSQIHHLEQEKKELADKLKSLDEEALKNQAVQLANAVFNGAINRVFEELGFKDDVFVRDVDFSQLKHYLGSEFWRSPKIDVDLGASVTTKFRRAFLTMGIKTKEEIES